jgi:hypothetical protein
LYRLLLPEEMKDLENLTIEEYGSSLLPVFKGHLSHQDRYFFVPGFWKTACLNKGFDSRIYFSRRFVIEKATTRYLWS